MTGSCASTLHITAGYWGEALSRAAGDQASFVMIFVCKDVQDESYTIWTLKETGFKNQVEVTVSLRYREISNFASLSVVSSFQHMFSMIKLYMQELRDWIVTQFA